MTRIKSPNLGIYFPLQPSILSVSLRFMGAILLFLFLALSSLYLLLNEDLTLLFSIILFGIILFLLILTSAYHVVSSFKHQLNLASHD